MGGRSDTMGPFVEASGYEGGVWEEEEGQSQINLLIKTSCSNSIQGFRTLGCFCKTAKKNKLPISTIVLFVR